jgi:alpha-methylacyl-CoA racemase
MYTKRLKEETNAEWEKVFDGTDACCTPVSTKAELEKDGFGQRPIVTLKSSPGHAIAEGEAENRPPAQGQNKGVQGGGWSAPELYPGEEGEKLLAQWMGWRRGQYYVVKDGGVASL